MGGFWLWENMMMLEMPLRAARKDAHNIIIDKGLWGERLSFENRGRMGKKIILLRFLNLQIS